MTTFQRIRDIYGTVDTPSNCWKCLRHRSSATVSVLFRAVALQEDFCTWSNECVFLFGYHPCLFHYVVTILRIDRCNLQIWWLTFWVAQLLLCLSKLCTLQCVCLLALLEYVQQPSLIYWSLSRLNRDYLSFLLLLRHEISAALAFYVWQSTTVYGFQGGDVSIDRC